MDGCILYSSKDDVACAVHCSGRVGRSIGKHVCPLVVIKGATSGNINLAACEVLSFSAPSGRVILEHFNSPTTRLQSQCALIYCVWSVTGTNERNAETPAGLGSISSRQQTQQVTVAEQLEPVACDQLSSRDARPTERHQQELLVFLAAKRHNQYMYQYTYNVRI